ncbi:hypothetical protein [Solimicrobium silvestre]|nr:hypothetical protein [Solimicrobium silvestre]
MPTGPNHTAPKENGNFLLPAAQSASHREEGIGQLHVPDAGGVAKLHSNG